MNIAYYHASKFGNGAKVAEEFKRIMTARGAVVDVQHVREEDRDAYQELIRQAKLKNPSLVIIAFPANSFEFLKAISEPGVVAQDPAASRYYGSSNENLRRLLENKHSSAAMGKLLLCL